MNRASSGGNTQAAEWDYCTVDVQLVDDGRGFSEAAGPGLKTMWFRFVARADGANGPYLADSTVKIPLANMPGATLAPDRNNNGHRSALERFVETLQEAGWELMPDGSGDWWQRRLRRPAAERQVQPRWNVRDVVLIALLVLALLWIGWLLFV